MSMTKSRYRIERERERAWAALHPEPKRFRIVEDLQKQFDYFRGQGVQVIWMDQATYDAWVLEGNELCGSTNWDHKFNGVAVEIREVVGAPRVIGKGPPWVPVEEWLAHAYETVRPVKGRKDGEGD